MGCSQVFSSCSDESFSSVILEHFKLTEKSADGCSFSAPSNSFVTRKKPKCDKPAVMVQFPLLFRRLRGHFSALGHRKGIEPASFSSERSRFLLLQPRTAPACGPAPSAWNGPSAAGAATPVTPAGAFAPRAPTGAP